MTISTVFAGITDANDLRDAIRAHIIESLNTGMSIRAAVAAAIDAGADENIAHSCGRALRTDMVAVKKRQAMKGVRTGILWMVGAVVLVVVTFIVRIPFGSLIAIALFLAGIVRIFLAIIDFLNVEANVR